MAANEFSYFGIDYLTKEPHPGPSTGLGGLRQGVNTRAENRKDTKNPPTCHPYQMPWWMYQLVIFGCIPQTLGPANLSQEMSSSKKQGMAKELALPRARTELLLRFHREK